MVKILIAMLGLASWAACANDDTELIFELEPQQVVAPCGNWGGTEKVRIRLRNKTSDSVEFSSAQWLVIERADSPGRAVFAPVAPFVPLELRSNEAIEVVWRLRNPPEYFDNTPDRTKPGHYVARAYVRIKGATAFRAANCEFDIGESVIAAGVRWLLVGLAAVVVTVVVFEWRRKKCTS